jgi:hypothetical protein
MALMAALRFADGCIDEVGSSLTLDVARQHDQRDHQATEFTR